MMVDDDQSILNMLSRILDLEGYDNTETSNHKNILSLLEESTPNLVILDVAMPKLDSSKLRDLVQQRSHTPVIMLTGTCEVTTLQDTKLLETDDYVNKSLRKKSLLPRLVTKLRHVMPGNHRQN
jgi:DNA-binding response OmpR family regulator